MNNTTTDNGMIKLMFSDQVPDAVEAGVRIMENSPALRKQASVTFDCSSDELKPDKDHVGLHLVALGDFEHYGCFFAGAPVQLIDGQKPIEQVQVGDLALTHKNRYRKVAATFEDLYTGVRVDLEVSGLPAPISSTSNHPYLVVRAERCKAGTRFKRRAAGTLEAWLDELAESAEPVPADQIRPGDYLVGPCAPELDAVLSMRAPDSADPYVMGLYVAEGCLAKEYKDIATRGEYNKILFTVSDKDRASIEYLQQWAVSLGRNPVAEGESYTSEEGIRLTYGNKELAAYLDKLFGHLAGTKHIRPEVFALPAEDKLRFLAGYCDGDGCMVGAPDYPRCTGTVLASTVSFDLAMDLQRLANSAGVPMTVSLCHNYERNRKVEGFGKGRGDLPIYSLHIGSRVSNAVVQYCKRLRPHDKVMRFGGAHQHTSGRYVLSPVRKSTHTHVEDVYKYNIEVEDDHTYVVMSQAVMNSNRNGDCFNKKACTDYHGTFVTHGAVFEHHKNRDRDKNLGTIVKSAYNEPMGRIELFVHAHREKAAEHLDKLYNTGELSYSMACRVARDRCNVCNTFRKSASDPNQCEHVATQLGKTLADGTVVCTHNDEPKFFDISFVSRPADRIAWHLKTAGAARVEDAIKAAADAGIWVPDELEADVPGYSEKLALVKQLSKVEADYLRISESGVKTASDRYLNELLKSATCSVPDAVIDQLRAERPADVLRKLAACGIVMDVDSFFKYAFGLDYGDVADNMPAIRSDVEHALFSRLHKSGAYQKVCCNHYFDVDNANTVRYGLDRLHCEDGVKTAGVACSFRGSPVKDRIVDMTIQGFKPTVIKRGSCVESGAAPGGGACVYAAYKLSALRSAGWGGDEESGRAVALAVAQNMVNKTGE